MEKKRTFSGDRRGSETSNHWADLRRAVYEGDRFDGSSAELLHASVSHFAHIHNYDFLLLVSGL